MEPITIYIYSKSIKNTMNIFTHKFFSIPDINLEIHPGQFFYGTHHTIGKFSNRSTLVGEHLMCQNCLTELLDAASDLSDIWYYPVINCETLTQGLLYHNAISYQTILCTIIITSFVLGISNPIFFLFCLFCLFLLLMLNNIHLKYAKSKCVHYKNKKVYNRV